MNGSGALGRLADALGVLPGYLATTGQWVPAGTEAVLATVRRLGADIDTVEQAEAALAELERRRARQVVEPVLVAWDGVLPEVAVRSARPVARLDLESGEAGPELLVSEGRVRLTRRLPFGRHELVVHGDDGAEHVAVVFAAPTVAWRPRAGSERQWGVFAPTYALRRSSAPAAIGDLADLEATFDWLHRRGGQVVVTLPMLAGFLDDPAECSPYAPVSRRFWNELYADVREPAARAGIDLGSFEGEFVDYRQAWRARRAVLERLSERLLDDGDLEFYRQRNPLVEQYARFRAAGARHGRNWRAWPSRLPGDLDPAEVRLHVTGQWLMQRQLARLQRKVAARGQLLALDLPLGCHPDGFDVWAEGDLFVDGVSVGAPPDSFFTRGQDWGFPPLHPERSRQQGHRYVQECIRHHVRHAGLMRLDHILGLQRLYWVHRGEDAAHGVYVRYPMEELLAVISLECSRAGAVVVGENLGTVPPEITEAMARHGMLGCAVSQFDLEALVEGDGYLPGPPVAAVATLNTHDTATFAGFWTGREAEDRSALGLLDADGLAVELQRRAALRAAVTSRFGIDPCADSVTAAGAVLGELAAGDAAFVVLNVEDGWAEPGPQNVPGTVHERPNWRRRVAVELDLWEDHPGLGRLVDAVAAARPGWGRPLGPPTPEPGRLAQEPFSE